MSFGGGLHKRDGDQRRELTFPAVLRREAVLVDQQRRDLGRVPAAVVEDEQQDRDVVALGDPERAFHLREQEGAVSDAAGWGEMVSRENTRRKVRRHSHGNDKVLRLRQLDAQGAASQPSEAACAGPDQCAWLWRERES